MTRTFPDWLLSGGRRRRRIVADRAADDSVLAAAEDVLSCDQSNVVVLMSLRTASYHTLDEVGSRVWKALGTGATLRAVIDRVMSDVETRDPAVDTELRTFVGDLIRRGLVTLDPLRPPRRVRTNPSDSAPRRDNSEPAPLAGVSLCVLGLAAVSVALSVLRLEQVWRYAHGRTRSYRQGRMLEPRYAGELSRRIALAASLCPWKAQCLEQSLLTLWWLRRAGFDAHLRFGVLQYPFHAHTWVEVGGVPVNDNADTLKLYRAFPVFEIARY